MNEQGGKRSERPEGDTGEDTREPGTEPTGEARDEAPEEARDEAAREPEAEAADSDADRADASAAGADDTADAEADDTAETTVVPAQPAAEPTASFDEDDLRRLLRGETPPPEEPAGPTGPTGPLDPELDGPAPLEEDDLRRILHGAADGLGPADTDATLEHLRRAVPVRRARKRQAVVGMAAAALFVGTAVPALVHVTTSPSSDDRPSIAGHGEDVQGAPAVRARVPARSPARARARTTPMPPAPRRSGTRPRAASPPSPARTRTAPRSPRTPAPPPPRSATPPSSAPPPPPPRDAAGTAPSTAPSASPTSPTAAVPSPAPAPSRRSPWARLTRAGSAWCRTPRATRPPASSPITAASQLVLAPGAAYEVKFAWIPSESCPNTGSGGDGGTGGTTPTDPTPPAEGSSGGTDQGATAPDVQPQLMRSDGGKADGSVTVSHAADPGAPTTATTVPDACAGTVYYTDALPAGG